MSTHGLQLDRLSLFSDAVFAVIITILVLDLKPPQSPNFAALLSLWPTAVSYAVSYLFVAIVWVNHHHVWRYANRATPGLIWGNFAPMFAVSMMPVVDRPRSAGVPPRARMMMRMRSLATLAVFAAAALVAVKYPAGGMALICLCLMVYLRPEAPGVIT